MEEAACHFSKIKLENKEGVLEITLNNPPANVLTQGMTGELMTAIMMARVDSSVERVLIQGSGDFFSAGADVNELKRIVEYRCVSEEARAFSERGHSVIYFLRNFPKPIIAFIDGYAFGGGMELALGCHSIIATKRSFMGLPELTLGIIPGWGGTVLFPRKFGAARQIGFNSILKGELFSAEEAFSYDLIDELAIGENEDLRPPALKPVSPFMRKLMEFAEPFSRADDKMLGYAFWCEAHLFSLACEHPDAKEGINAFLEKREAKFVGF